MSLCLAKRCVNTEDIALNAKLPSIFASNNVFNWVWQISWWACSISFLFNEMYIFQRQRNNLLYLFVNCFEMSYKYHASVNTQQIYLTMIEWNFITWAKTRRTITYWDNWNLSYYRKYFNWDIFLPKCFEYIISLYQMCQSLWIKSIVRN